MTAFIIGLVIGLLAGWNTTQPEYITKLKSKFLP